MNASVDEPRDELARDLGTVLGMATDPVAVFLLPPGPVAPEWDGSARLKGHRWCQALMRARHGESVLLDAEGIACPAAAAAFGFKPLPENLANGPGLVGFGIVTDPAVGREMFRGMTRLAPGSVGTLAACPLRMAPGIPDVVVLEGPPEILMWVALADLNAAGGARRQGDTAVLQATCVDAVVIPHVQQRLNFSLGCYGCREATDLGPDETVLGFPGARLPAIRVALDALNGKAVPRSRAKAVYQNLMRKEDSHG
ncbi:MAG TPA: DUF169 domain-containing protein [Myxococcota bacterium]|nr:DUF169 domain-containing protein [Myxococcota bacterium]